MRSGIESLIKLPLQIPSVTSVFLKQEKEQPSFRNGNGDKNVNPETATDIYTKEKELDLIKLSHGYIKYPQYDFF